MNEEDVRGKILLPFLKDLGFSESEIFLEKSFSIRLGKSQVKTGRSDILCKRHGQNLFIVELKKDSKNIDQQDIDQGISYARLLQDNIAPFTIVTNGKETKIFDSISRDELTGVNISEKSNYWKSGCSLSADVDLSIRYQALKNFISFSPENLKLFSKNQVQDRMGTIIGDIDNPYSKFIKELHVQRQELISSFKEFTASQASVFGLVGDAGVGKTSAMCSLTLQSLGERIVFFYNAALINKSPLEHIAQDLNMVFSSRTESEVILKKLDELGRYLNQDVIIFIDAIDEHVDSNLALELSEMALAVRSLDRIKICISCKSNIWNNILKSNDTPTYLFEELGKYHQPIPNLNGCPGFLLEGFNIEELKAIIPLYQKTFGFKGEISKHLQSELRNGFFLRIFSEVYSHREVPQKISDKDLIKKYLKQSLEKTRIGYQVGLRILSKIGAVITEHTYSSWETFRDEGLDVDELVEKLDFSLDAIIPEDLFARNILIKSNKEDSYNVSFYYSKIRDYIICFHSYKLDTLSDDKFYNSLEKFYENHIGESAMSFYIENASESHRRTLIQFKKDKSLQYVNTYNSYLDTHFRNLKEKFDPETNGEIGIYISSEPLMNGYALFPLEVFSNEKVQNEDLDVFAKNRTNDIFSRTKARRVHSGDTTRFRADQKKVVSKEIFKQLKEIIRKGRISVYNSDILMLEQVSTILYYYHKKLGYSFTISDFYIPRFNLIYPIDLIELKQRLYRFRVSEHYKRENYYREPRLDSATIEEKINLAIETSQEIPPLNVHGDYPPFEELYTLVNILLDRGYSVISQHHLPCPDISIPEAKALQEKDRKFELSKIRHSQFTEGQAKSYIEKFLKSFDTCYREFIDYTFPTLKERLPFYQATPHEYFVYMKDSDVLKWGMLGYSTSKDGKVNVNFKEYCSWETAHKQDRTGALHGFSLDQILHNSNYDIVKTIDHINTPKVDNFCVIRNWIYKFLKMDMEELFKENNA